MENDRRSFLKKVSGIGLGLTALPLSGQTIPKIETKLQKKNSITEICVFSKHLQFLDYDEMADTAAEIGFTGVDLTVRPGGHVSPEKATTQLPNAFRAIEKAGLKMPMIATAIDDPGTYEAQAILSTAANLEVKHYRMGYMKYDFDKGINETLDSKKYLIDKFLKMNEFFNITGNYQNHDGINIGAAIWDLWTLFENRKPEYIGCQYDIRHNTVEGGRSWPVDMQLISPFIHTLVLKDFKWEKIDGSWKIVNTPIGEGMVDFPKYFQMIKDLNIGGPVTLHFEYPLTEEPIENMAPIKAKEQVVAAMKKDLAKVFEYMNEAEI